jgi:hypothetical protein
MEKLIYELRPYFFILVGIVAACARPDKLMFASVAVLLFASTIVLHRRMKYRAWLNA